MYLTHSIIHQFHCYGSSEFTKRLIYYPRYQGFFQHFNAELVSESANFEPQHWYIMLITLYNFSVIFWPLYSYCLGLEPLAKWCQIMTCAKDHLNLHFRPSLVYVIICLCCSSRTFSTWINNFTMHAVKSFAFVWKQRWSILSSTWIFLHCLVLLPVHVDIVQNRCKQFHCVHGELVYTYWHLPHT